MTPTIRTRGAWLLLALAAPLLAADAPRPDDYAVGWTLRLDGEADFYRVPLSREVFAAALSPNLVDVAVFDDDDRPVPAFVHTPEPAAAPTAAGRALQAFAVADQARVAAVSSTVRVQASGNASVRAEVTVDSGSPVPELPDALRWYAVVDEPPRGVFAALELGWRDGGSSFVSGVDVDTSNDLEHWRPLKGGAVAAFRSNDSALTRDRVTLEGYVDEFLRVTVHQPPAGFALTRLALHHVPATPDLQRHEQQQDFAAAGDTATVDLGAALEVDRFEVAFAQGTGLVRARLESAAAPEGPWSTRGDALFYRFESGPAPVSSSAVDIHARPAARYWRAVLLGNGGLSAQLRLGWVPTELVFAATGTRPFHLVAGNAAQVSETHDVQQMRADARSLWRARSPATGRAELGPRHELAGEAAYDASPRRDWRAIVLWALLGAGVLLVLAMAVRLRRELGVST